MTPCDAQPSCHYTIDTTNVPDDLTDCLKPVCNIDGQVAYQADDTQQPGIPDGNPCTVDGCADGTRYPPVFDGSPCPGGTCQGGVCR